MTIVSKNVYIDKFDDIVNEYNDPYHRTTKMKLIVKDNTYIDYIKRLMIKILNLKLLIMLEYQNKKNILAKGYTRNWSEEFL